MIKKERDSFQVRAIRLFTKILKSSSFDLDRYIKIANLLTRERFGYHRTLFNPIYISNICNNDCIYCGFRKSNMEKTRITLSPYESSLEAKFLLNNRGIKNILILAGDYEKKEYMEMLINNIKEIIRSVRPDWLGIEVAPLDIKDYKTLAHIGINSVTLFQETYNQNRYSILHDKNGPKANYHYRKDALKRAIKGGIKEVGLGVLYGCGDYYEDSVEMAKHALELMKENPDIKLRFSFPRLIKETKMKPYTKIDNVTEEMIYKAIVAFRNVFPDSSIVLTGRESTAFLLHCANIANVLGKDGKTAVGGYSINSEETNLEQFKLKKDADFAFFKDQLSNLGYIT